MGSFYRCKDGHLFARSYMSLLFVPHLGSGKAYAKCPVDGKRQVITEVKRRDLSEAQIAEASARSNK